jgi:hypothetical protein
MSCRDTCVCQCHQPGCPTRRRGSTPVITSMLAAPPPQASWWMLAPWLAMGAVAVVVGLATSRKGPR